jgi:hypothetical protein
MIKRAILIKMGLVVAVCAGILAVLYLEGFFESRYKAEVEKFHDSIMEKIGELYRLDDKRGRDYTPILQDLSAADPEMIKWGVMKAIRYTECSIRMNLEWDRSFMVREVAETFGFGPVEEFAPKDAAAFAAAYAKPFRKAFKELSLDGEIYRNDSTQNLWRARECAASASDAVTSDPDMTDADFLYGLVSMDGAKHFHLDQMSDAEIDAFITEAVTDFDSGQYALQDHIQLQQNGMSDFEFNRAVGDIRDRIVNAPSLWAKGDTVKVNFKTVGELMKYRFDQNVYVMCILGKVSATGFEDLYTPNLLFVFPPRYTSSEPGQYDGVGCTPSQAVAARAMPNAPNAYGRFYVVSFPMTADQGERLEKASSGGMVDVSLECDPHFGNVGSENGWRRTAGVDCSVTGGGVSAGSERVDIASFQ